MRKTYLGFGGLAALLFCGSALPALAEASADAAQTGTRTMLEEVVVTARKRSEGLEHVPATVNVLTSEALTRQSIHTEEDLQTAVPGLVIRQGPNPSLFNYVIRGESLDTYSGSIPGVQPYVNEVPQASNSPTSFYDLENIQVLKGPQGTLFGRNTTGGAVLYTTTRPTNEYGGYVSVQYGNLNRLITEAAVNLPIVADKVLLRLAGTHTSGGAYMYNLYNDQWLGDNKEDSGRATLLLKPTDNLTNLTTVEYSNFGGTPVPSVDYYTIPCGAPGGSYTCLFAPSNPAFQSIINPANEGKYIPGYPNGYVYPGGLATFGAFERSHGNYAVDTNGVYQHTGYNVLVANTTSYDISPQATLKNIFGYGYSLTGNRYNNNEVPYAMLQSAAGLPGGNAEEQETSNVVSDELQLSGKLFNNRLSYIVGGYYEDEKDSLNSPLDGLGIDGFTADSIYTYAVRYHILTQERSYAVFSQETFAITDKLNLTGGIRGTWVTLSSMQGAGSVLLYDVGVPGYNPHQQTNESNPSWNVTLDYHVTPALMVYVATRGSWRIGGYQPTATPIGNNVTAENDGNYFLPETVKDVEIGAKFNGRIADMPLQANLDAYDVWANNIQKVGYAVIDNVSQGSTVNVGAGEIRGIEGDFLILPTSHLRFGGNVSWNDAEYTNDQGFLFGVPTSFGPYGDAPRYSGSLFGELAIPLAENRGVLTYHVDGYAQSSFYFTNTDNSVTPGTRVPGYVLVNMRLDWANPVGAKGLTVSGFVKNLGNKLYYLGGTGSAQGTSFEAAVEGTPRTYGFVLRYAF